MRSVPSAWEAQMVSEWRQRCKTTAASILGLWRIGHTKEDAEQLLILSVVEACRSWADAHEDKPPPKFINCAMRRRKFKLWDHIKSATLNGVQEAVPHQKPPEQTFEFSDRTPEKEAQQKQELEATKAILSAVSLVLSPSEYALLRLRCEGHTHTEIATLLSDPHVAQTLKWKLYRTKKKARNFLEGCGIVTIGDAVEASQESQSATYQKAQKAYKNDR